MDCSPPGYRPSVYGISQARILEWVPISFPTGSSRPRDGTWVSYIAGGFFINSAIRKTQECGNTRIQFVLEGLTVSWRQSEQKVSSIMVTRAEKLRNESFKTT